MLPIVLAVVGVVAVSVGGLAWWVRFRSRLVDEPATRTTGQMTVPHDGPTMTAYECWTSAIDTLVGAGAEIVRDGGGLHREWSSSPEFTGEERDTEFREYRLREATVVLELDSLHGFAMSGDPEVVKLLADRFRIR